MITDPNDINPPISNRYAARTVRNILANELGLDKPAIEGIINDRLYNIVKDILEQRIFSKYFETFVYDCVADIIKNGVRVFPSHWSNKTTINDYINYTIRNYVQELVSKQINISVTSKQENLDGDS